MYECVARESRLCELLVTKERNNESLTRELEEDKKETGRENMLDGSW
jgi:hypothetical protein